MRVILSDGGNYEPSQAVIDWLKDQLKVLKAGAVLCGMASGTDMIAYHPAIRCGIPVKKYVGAPNAKDSDIMAYGQEHGFIVFPHELDFGALLASAHSERLEQVHKGLGEMQSLATGVGDLKKVLTNGKTRGTWGEVQLGVLLAQILNSDQSSTNVATKEGGERMEFAIKLPGQALIGTAESKTTAFSWGQFYLRIGGQMS